MLQRACPLQSSERKDKRSAVPPDDPEIPLEPPVWAALKKSWRQKHVSELVLTLIRWSASSTGLVALSSASSSAYEDDQTRSRQPARRPCRLHHPGFTILPFPMTISCARITLVWLSSSARPCRRSATGWKGMMYGYLGGSASAQVDLRTSGGGL